MLLELVFLSFCTLTLAHLGLNEATTPVDSIEYSFAERLAFHQDSKGTHELALEKGQTSKDRLKLGFPENPGTKNFKNQFDIRQQGTRNRFPEMKKNWEENRDQVTSLVQDSKELNLMKFEIQYVLEKVKKQEGLDPSKVQKFTRAVEALSQINEKLINFKQLKLVELGKIDLENSNANLVAALLAANGKESATNPTIPIEIQKSIPNDIIAHISKKTWRNVANSIVDELRHLIIEEEILPDILPNLTSFKLQLNEVFDFALKIIDFLFKYKFADQNKVRSFFQDPKIIRSVIAHAEICFRFDIRESIVFGKSDITDHWYWRILHDSFKVLSKKDEKIINAYVLLDSACKVSSRMEAMYPNDRASSILKEFFKFFNQKMHLQEFLELNSSKKTESTELGVKISERYSRYISDVSKLIILRIKTEDESFTSYEDLRTFLFRIVAFIDQDQSPGIIQKMIHNPSLIESAHFQNDSFWSYALHHNMANISAKVADISNQATGYHDYIKKKYTADWATSSFHKSFFDSCLNKLNDLHQELHNEKHKISNIISSSDISSTTPLLHQTLDDDISESKEKVKNILNEFQI